MEGKKNLSDRLYEFACRVILVVNKLPKSIAAQEIGRQLVRAGTSIAANYEEAKGGFSRDDFIYKLNVAFKEARETNIWLRLLRDAEILQWNQLEFLIKLLLSGQNFSLPYAKFDAKFDVKCVVEEGVMSLNLMEDIRSVTELKRKTREILEQIHHTGRPVILTVNGKADAVLIDAKVYEKHLKASNLARLIVPAEEDIAVKRTRPVRTFLKEFKNARKISG